MLKRICFAALAALSASPALAYTGEGCTYTPTYSQSAKEGIREIKGWASREWSGADKSENRACLYYGIGLLRAFDGDDVSAIDAYTRAITIMRNFADAYEMRGDAYAELGMAAKAEADYARAAEATRDTADGLYIRCWARAVRGVPLDRALNDCNEAIRQRPRKWAYWTTRCLVHLRMGNDTGAISDCSTAHEGEPKWASPLYLRGLAKIRSGDKAGGHADIAVAKEKNERIADAYAVYGVKLMQKK